MQPDQPLLTIAIQPYNRRSNLAASSLAGPASSSAMRLLTSLSMLFMLERVHGRMPR